MALLELRYVLATLVRNFEMEFEIDERKKSQLDAVLDRARHWIFPMAGGERILRQSGTVAHSSYEGFVRNRDDTPAFLSSTGNYYTPSADRTFHIAIMTWKATAA